MAKFLSKGVFNNGLFLKMVKNQFLKNKVNTKILQNNVIYRYRHKIICKVIN